MPTRTGGDRAAWVWTVDDPDAAVAFATRRGLDELFVHVPVGIDRHPSLARVTRLVSMARQRGIRIAALGGDPGWLADPRRVIAGWLRPALGTGLFHHVHVDIEPPISPDRPDPALVERFITTIGTLADATPDGVALEADVRFWYPDVPAGDRDLATALVSLVDAVTVLAYRNRTAGDDGTVALARRSAAVAAAAGVRFRIGQETTYLGPEPHHRKQTFHGRRRSELESAMAEIDDAFAASPGYAGTAVHDWLGYRRLRAG